MTVRLLALTLVALAALACNGDNGPTPTATTTDRTSNPTASTRPPTGSPAAKGWRTLAPMPTPRSEVAAAEFEGDVYVIGGFQGDGSPSTKVEAYSPKTDTWREIAPLPRPRHHAAAFSFRQYDFEPATLFVVGGFESSFADPQATVFSYSVSTGWVEKASMPTARGGHAIAILGGGQYFVVGGVGLDGENVAAAEVYDTGADSWTVAAPMPTPRDHLVAALAQHQEGIEIFRPIYAIGGRSNLNFGNNLDANEQYDPQTDTWQERAPLPTARSGIAAARLGDQIGDVRVYVFGGEESAGTFDENEAYDPQTDTWETLEPMPTARHGLGAAVVGDTIYVIGGGETPGLSVSGANEAFTP